jgi:hypothetical protein
MESRLMAAIDSRLPRTPSAVKRAVIWLRDLGLLATAIAVPLTLLAIAIAAVNIAVSDVRTNSEFRGSTTEKLKQIEASILSLRAQVAASFPGDRTSQEQAKRVLAEARAKSVTLPLEIVDQMGVRFINASSEAPQAWNTVEDILAYRSLLNAEKLPPDVPGLDKFEMITEEEAGRPNPWRGLSEYLMKERNLRIGAFGIAPPGKGAIILLLNPKKDYQAEINAYLLNTATPTWILAEGKSDFPEYPLNNLYVRNVILKDLTVLYRGTPIVLDNVFFVNCRFRFQPVEDATRQLASALFATPVNFKTGL